MRVPTDVLIDCLNNVNSDNAEFLCLALKPLVLRQIKRITKGGDVIDRDLLIQEGVIGLLEVYNSGVTDPKKFISRVLFKIQENILAAISQRNVPIEYFHKSGKLRTLVNCLRDKRNDSPEGVLTIEQLESVAVSTKSRRSTVEAAYALTDPLGFVSKDKKVRNAKGDSIQINWEAMIEKSSTPQDNPEQIYIRNETNVVLRESIKTILEDDLLSPFEEDVLLSRVLNTVPDSCREVGIRNARTPQAVTAAEKRVKDKVRKVFLKNQ